MGRCRLTALALGTAVLLAACGSSSHSGASGPLAADLSYFPSGSPFVGTLQTGSKLDSTQMSKLEAGEANSAVIKAALFAELAKAGVNYNRDVKPLFGTPIAFGIGAAQVSSGTTPFLAVWQTHSSTALAHLVSDLHGVTKTGTHDGATLYSLGGAAFAIDGSVALISQNSANLTAALDRHQSGGGFSSSEYGADTSGLPSDALLSFVGDLQSALGTPKAAQARRVPWVAAIKGYGVTFTGTQKAGSLQFRIDTSGHSLSASQLPIAAGSQAPELTTGDGVPIAFGLRDPAQLYAFVLGADQAADPAAYEKLEHKLQTDQQGSGVDIDSFLHSLTGDVQVSSTGQVTVGRLQTTAANVAAWEKLLSQPGGGSTTTALGGGFYRITESGGTSLVAGAVGDELLLGKATVAQEQAYAHAASTPSHGSGAIAFQVSVGDLIKLALSRDAAASANPLIGTLGSEFGDLTGSMQATPQALTGTATLQVNSPAG